MKKMFNRRRKIIGCEQMENVQTASAYSSFCRGKQRRKLDRRSVTNTHALSCIGSGKYRTFRSFIHFCHFPINHFRTRESHPSSLHTLSMLRRMQRHAINAQRHNLSRDVQRHGECRQTQELTGKHRVSVIG